MFRASALWYKRAEQETPNGGPMLPLDVEEAKIRMDKADAALRADIESNTAVDSQPHLR
jgi:hypothetical protein